MMAYQSPSNTSRSSECKGPANYLDLTTPLTERKRFGPYVCNFIFIPHEEVTNAAERLTARLSELRS